MRNLMGVAGLVLCLVAIPAGAGEDPDPKTAIDGVLTNFHQAASDADGQLYFSLFAEGATFMGTDATERWSVDEFKAFAEPYFSEGRGWTYEKTERHIAVAANGETAWFDEMLWNEKYGVCRGTGVLVRSDGIWKIVQYNLSFPIPNDLSGEITKTIKDFENRVTGK